MRNFGVEGRAVGDKLGWSSRCCWLQRDYEVFIKQENEEGKQGFLLANISPLPFRVWVVWVTLDRPSLAGLGWSRWVGLVYMVLVWFG